MLGFRFQVVSSSHSIPEVQAAILKFVNHVPELLGSLALISAEGEAKNNSESVEVAAAGTDTRNNGVEVEESGKVALVDHLVAFLETSLAVKPSLSETARDTWWHIEDRRYDFDRSISVAKLALQVIYGDQFPSGPIGKIELSSLTKKLSTIGIESRAEKAFFLDNLRELRRDLADFARDFLVSEEKKRLLIIQSSVQFRADIANTKQREKNTLAGGGRQKKKNKGNKAIIASRIFNDPRQLHALCNNFFSNK